MIKPILDYVVDNLEDIQQHLPEDDIPGAMIIVRLALAEIERREGPYKCSGGDSHLPACGGICGRLTNRPL